jgi:sugar lactone lactonase YvrE
MSRAIPIAIIALALASCATPTAMPAAPHWTIEDATFFPEDRSLTHAEDGVVLPDGRLLVGDWEHGLVMLAADGTRRPFGDFAAAGFRTRPAPDWGSPNGVAFEPDGRHVLVADIVTGSIYRADTASGEVRRIYDHLYGVNTAVRDSSGAIWFTQSTENPEGAGSEARMFAAIDGLSDGALFRIAPDQVGRPNPVAERKLTGLAFANGIAIDERRGQLYVAETMANRVLALPVDIATGAVGARRVLSEIATPDNVELDGDGALWVVSPLGNELLIVDPATGATRSVFRPTPEASTALVAELRRRQAAREPILPLLGPGAHGPLPGLLTGVIVSPDGGPVYVSGLGNALVRLDRRAGHD